MNILGISAFFHDSAAALVRDGRLIAAVEEEKLTRVKHDSAMPYRAIEFCLRAGQISPGDLDHVVYYEKPLRKFNRVLSMYASGGAARREAAKTAILSWSQQKLWVRKQIADAVGISVKRVLFCEHHLSHAASAYLTSPFREATVLTIDGIGEIATAAIGIGDSGHISILEELHFPHSLGLLYADFTKHLGFAANDAEYKVMGLAAYGQPRYVDRIHAAAPIAEDGSIAVNPNLFGFASGENEPTDRFIGQFGPPRSSKDEVLARHADLAASIQAYAEEAVLAMAQYARRRVGCEPLCLAGGVALNCIANGRLLKSGSSRDIYIQPAAGDAGGALGAALWASSELSSSQERFVMSHAYWGPSYRDSELRSAARVAALNVEELSDEDKLIERATNSLAAGKVIGWFSGKTEWGPRALGNRSILADPSRPEMRDIINAKVKHREEFRPFAPAVLAEDASSHFDLPDAQAQFPPRFMLYGVPALEHTREQAPAIVHVDGTSRLQTVHAETNPTFADLLASIQSSSTVLLNTSLNVRGQPTSCAPEDAVGTFLAGNLDELFLGPFVVTR